MAATVSTTTLPAIRVLLVEAHLMIRVALRLLLESRRGLEVVGEAAGHADAIALAMSEQPDIILLDLDLGAENGLDLLPELRTVANHARVLVLTGVRNVEAHRKALCEGGYSLC